MSRINKFQRIKYQTLLILLLMFPVCFVPILGQESGKSNQYQQLQEMLARHKKEKLASESEMQELNQEISLKNEEIIAQAEKMKEELITKKQNV